MHKSEIQGCLCSYESVFTVFTFCWGSRVAFSSAPGTVPGPSPTFCVPSPDFVPPVPGGKSQSCCRRIFFFQTTLSWSSAQQVTCSQCSWSPFTHATESVSCLDFLFFFFTLEKPDVPLPLNFRGPTSSWWDRFLEIPLLQASSEGENFSFVLPMSCSNHQLLSNTVFASPLPSLGVSLVGRS